MPPVLGCDHRNCPSCSQGNRVWDCLMSLFSIDFRDLKLGATKAKVFFTPKLRLQSWWLSGVNEPKSLSQNCRFRKPKILCLSNTLMVVLLQMIRGAIRERLQGQGASIQWAAHLKSSSIVFLYLCLQPNDQDNPGFAEHAKSKGFAAYLSLLPWSFHCFWVSQLENSLCRILYSKYYMQIFISS